MENEREIIVFEAGGKEVQQGVDYDTENIWATQAQIAEIFKVDRTRVTRHINNILKMKKLIKWVMCGKRTLAQPRVRPVFIL